MNNTRRSESNLKAMVAWSISPLRLSSQLVFGEIIHRNLFRDLTELPLHRRYQLAVLIRHIEAGGLTGRIASLRDACILGWLAPDLIPPPLLQHRLLQDWRPDPDDRVSIATDLEMLMASDAIVRAVDTYDSSNICRWLRPNQLPDERNETVKELTATLCQL